MNIYLFLALFVASIILLIRFILFNYYQAKNRNEQFSLLNHFPYEYMDNDDKRKEISNFINVIILVLFMVTFYLLNSIYFKNGILIFTCVSAIIASVMFIFLNRYSFLELKRYLLFSTLIIVLTSFSSISLLVSSIQTYMDIKDNFALLVAIFSGITSLISLFLFINPKLNNYCKMDVVTNKDNSVSYKRPRIIYLALSIWISLFILIFNMLLMSIYGTLI